MTRWQLFYEKWIVRFLVKEPLKHGSYFLSHGFFHFIMCILVGVVTALWWHKNVSSSETIMHDITLEFKRPRSPYSLKDTITVLGINFIIDSDSLLKKTNNKYKSKISVSYYYDYSNRDSLDKDKPKDPTVITLHSEPYLDDLYVDQDSIWFEPTTITEKTDSGIIYRSILKEKKYETHLTKKTLSDSAFEVSVISAKNLTLISGDIVEGTQTINFYSNKLGKPQNDSYYNYFIDFNFLPLVKNTQKSNGYYNISIQIGDVTTNRGFHHVGNKKLLYQYIYPQPDVFTNGYLYYYSDEVMNRVARNHCIIIQATDIEAMNRNNRKAIIYSVLVGTGAALFFDILIQLVRELRNVNRKKDEEEAEQKAKENNKQTDNECNDNMSVVEESESNNVTTEVNDNVTVSDNTITEEKSDMKKL